MARGKKAKTGGKSKSAAHRSPHNRSFVPSGASSPPENPRATAFSLRDAARNSEHPRSFWSSSALNLRHQAVSFVRGDDQSETQDDMETDPTPPEPLSRPLELSRTPSAVPEEVLADKPAKESDVDSPATRVLIPDAASPPPESSPHSPPSPFMSDSGEEVVFTGRNNMAQTLGNEKRQQQGLSVGKRRVLPGTDLDMQADYIALAGGRPPRFTPVNGWDDTPQNWVHRGERLAKTTLKAPKQSQKSRSRRTRRRMRLPDSSDGELAAVLGDYVANMRASGEVEDMPVASGVESFPQSQRNGWGSTEIEDFGDMSTSEEVLDAVKQVLAKRHRPAGIQYLVVWEDQTVDEARWIPRSSLTMEGAAELIEAFEQQEKQVPAYPEENSDSEDDDEINWGTEDDDDDEENDDDDDDDEDEDFEDERDLIERRMARMTDEHIARLFQKQEFLGMTSNELQIFDGDEDMDGSEDALGEPSRSRVALTRDRKRRKQRRLSLEDDMMLDGGDYGDFDVMDRDRPSLVKGNGLDPFSLDLSDSDLAQSMQATWASDRKKKRLMKQEREELRAQGLLGRKNKFKPDLKARYSDGMSLNHLEKELEGFLFNGQQDSLSLPPMDKGDRKKIHDIANHFGLKSKSQGSSKKRFPVLYKTSRTVDFDSARFQRLRTLLDRRFFPRMDQQAKSRSVAPKRGGGIGRADHGYRDGEIVGAAAPELGADNRGRAMLEKMGWSMGTALGSLNNQGILKPIQHVVKNSRAGLG